MNDEASRYSRREFIKRVIASGAMCAVLVGHIGVKGDAPRLLAGTAPGDVPGVQEQHGGVLAGDVGGQAAGGLRENASSLSCGVSADIRSTHSAEK